MRCGGVKIAFNRNKLLGLGGLALSAVIATVLINSASAQGGPSGLGDGFGGPQDQPGRGFQFPPIGIGGPSRMVGDEKNLYILQGNRLVKVKKADLSVESERMLPMPRPPQPGAPDVAPM